VKSTELALAARDLPERVATGVSLATVFFQVEELFWPS
jgi:hypothetical protein